MREFAFHLGLERIVVCGLDAHLYINPSVFSFVTGDAFQYILVVSQYDRHRRFAVFLHILDPTVALSRSPEQSGGESAATR